MSKNGIYTIVATIIGALVTGFITWLLNVRKEWKEDLKEKQHEWEKRFENRPEFDIVDYKDYLFRVGYGIKQKCDIELFVAQIEKIDKTNCVGRFRESDLNSKEWCCVIYTLKNTGKTDIVRLNLISTYKRDTCIFSCANAKKLANMGMLSYLEIFDKKIRVGETVTIKLCYHKDRRVTGAISAMMLIALEDYNKHYWYQSLFIPQNKIEGSHEVEAKEYFSNYKSTLEWIEKLNL